MTDQNAIGAKELGRPINEVVWVMGYSKTGLKPQYENIDIQQAYVSVEAAKSAAAIIFPRLEWRDVVDKSEMAIQLDVDVSELSKIDEPDIKENGADSRLWTVHYGYPLGFELERSGNTIVVVKAIPLKEWWDNRVWQTSSLFDPQKEMHRLSEVCIKQAQDLKRLENLVPDLEFASRLLSNVKTEDDVQTLIDLALKTLKPYIIPSAHNVD